MNLPEPLRAPRLIGCWKSGRRGSRAKKQKTAILRLRNRYPTLAGLPRERMVANISEYHHPQGLDVPPRPVNVKQVLVYLTHEQHAALLKVKDRLGVPVSETIRRAIDRYLKQMESRK